MRRPTWILFDLNGTLTDPGPLGAPWDRPDLGLRILGDAVRGGMTDALTGGVRPFADHLRAALAVVAAQEGLDPAGIHEATEHARALPAWPDALRALETLRRGGFRLAVLTNSGARAGRATLLSAGLLDLFDAVLGVDAVGTFKPDRRTYDHAVAELGCSPGEVLLVAAHAWDVAGAHAAGLRTAWVARGEVVRLETTPTPERVGTDLREIAAGLLAL
ncbi:haloacid dehalogenase type II [Patulibacter sp. NPDC049589]|uniref:haloacid dehalogenase type II n=1 Tax=Patulibacter sp. NPDC049589 TaxID=3154731 RepID=UPI00342541D6